MKTYNVFIFVMFFTSFLISSCQVNKTIGSKKSSLFKINSKSDASYNSRQIENLMNASNNTINIEFPSGEIYLEKPIVNNGKRVLLSGKGKFLTNLIFLNKGPSSIIYNSEKNKSYLYGGGISNLTITNLQKVSLVSLSKQRGFRIENVNFTGGDIGLEIDFVYDFLLSNCYISKFNNIGISITDKGGSNTSVYFEHLHIEGKGDAIHVKGMGGLRIEKSIIQSNNRGIVEKDGNRGSSIFIKDSHFEGNQRECFYQERTFKPGKSSSFISVENTFLLRGTNTDNKSAVAYLNFGSIYLFNSTISYFKGIDRAKESIGKFYSDDKVIQYRYQNPQRPNFLYKKN